MLKTPKPQVRSIVFDLAVACAVLFLTSTAPTVGTPWLFGSAIAAALLGRRRWPFTVFAVVAGVTAVQAITSIDSDGQTEPQIYHVAVLIAMYSVVKCAPRLLVGWLAGNASGPAPDRRLTSAPPRVRLSACPRDRDVTLGAVQESTGG